MSEETTNPEVTEPTETADELPKFKSAFLMLKEADGSWSVTSDLSFKFEVEALPSRLDVRQACAEITYAISNQDTAATVLGLLQANLAGDSQQNGAEMSDASSEATAE